MVQDVITIRKLPGNTLPAVAPGDPRTYFYQKANGQLWIVDANSATQISFGEFAEFVKDNNATSSGKMSFWSGTLAEFNAITTKDPDTEYTIIDDEAATVITQTVTDETDTVPSNAAVYNALNGVDSTATNITADSGTKYYFGRTVSGTVSGTATVVLTNCAGALTVSGNTAKVYANNCPNLSITKSASAWGNVYVDGVARWKWSGTIEKVFSNIANVGSSIADINIPSWTSDDTLKIGYTISKSGWGSDYRTVIVKGSFFAQNVDALMLEGNMSLGSTGSNNVRGGVLAKVGSSSLTVSEPPFVTVEPSSAWTIKIRVIELERSSYNG